MLNLLIAIMGDTYDRVQEVAQEAQAKEICSFISEYDFLFPEEEFLRAPITIIASLEKAEDEEVNSWEGKIGVLKNFIGRSLKNQEVGAKKERQQIEVKLDKIRLESEKNIDQMKVELKGEMNEMKEQMSRIEALLMSKNSKSEKDGTI